MRKIAVVQTRLVDENVGIRVAEGDDVFGCGNEGGCFEKGVGLQWCSGVVGKGAGVQKKWLGRETRGAALDGGRRKRTWKRISGRREMYL